MRPDESGLAAAGLLQGALGLAKQAQEALSRSSDEQTRAQCDRVKLIEAHVLATIASISKDDQVVNATTTSWLDSDDDHAVACNVDKLSLPDALGGGCTDTHKEVISVHAQPETVGNMPLQRAPKDQDKTTAIKMTSKRSMRSILKHDSQYREKVLRAQEAFRAFDRDGGGTLDRTELQQTMQTYFGIDESIVEELVEHMMQKLGGVDEEITQADFIDFLTGDASGDDDDKFLSLVHVRFDENTVSILERFSNRNDDMVFGNSTTLLDPRMKMCVNWDISVGLLLILTIFTMPLSMAFEAAQNNLKPLDVLADAIFLLDIFKHFNTGYVDEYEFIIMDRSKVRKNYLYGWFVPDMLSSLPVELMDVAFTGLLPSNLKATKALKLLRLSRLAKIFRILKLPKLMKLFQDLQDAIEDHLEFKFDDAVLAMGSLFLALLVLSHWVGCCSFMVCREFNFPEDSWVVNANIVDETVGTQYSWCMFRALMTMIGAGFEDPPIVNTVCTERTTWCTIEHWNTLICLYIGSIFYALLIASVSDIMSHIDKGGAKLAEQLWGLNEYLKYKKVPVPIKNRVRTFFRIHYADGKCYDETELLHCLPPKLRGEIITFNHKDLFDQVPLLCAESTPMTFLESIASSMIPRFVFTSEEIIQEDTTGDEMYFIDSGIVQIFSKHCDFAVKAIADGCYFGEVACLFDVKRTATVTARTNSNLVVVTKDGLMEAFKDNPDMQEQMVRTAKKRMTRLACLNEENGDTMNFTDEDLKDHEDEATKFFIEVKIPKPPTAETSASSNSLSKLFRTPSSNMLHRSVSMKSESDEHGSPHTSLRGSLGHGLRRIGSNSSLKAGSNSSMGSNSSLDVIKTTDKNAEKRNIMREVVQAKKKESELAKRAGERFSGKGDAEGGNDRDTTQSTRMRTSSPRQRLSASAPRAGAVPHPAVPNSSLPSEYEDKDEREELEDTDPFLFSDT